MLIKTNKQQQTKTTKQQQQQIKKQTLRDLVHLKMKYWLEHGLYDNA
jgi:hypothetical protein